MERNNKLFIDQQRLPLRPLPRKSLHVPVAFVTASSTMCSGRPGTLKSACHSQSQTHVSQTNGERGPNWPTLPELIPISVAWSRLGVLLLPLDGMLVHRRLPPSILSPIPIYTPGWREALWEWSVLPKNTTHVQWPRPTLDLESNALTIRPPRLPADWQNNPNYIWREISTCRAVIPSLLPASLKSMSPI